MKGTGDKNWFWTFLVLLGLGGSCFYSTVFAQTGSVNLDANPVVTTNTAQVEATPSDFGSGQKAGLWLNLPNTQAKYSSVYVKEGQHLVITVPGSLCADVYVAPGAHQGVLVPLGSQREWELFVIKYKGHPYITADDCGASCNNPGKPAHSIVCPSAGVNIPAAVPVSRVVYIPNGPYPPNPPCKPEASLGILDKCTFYCDTYSHCQNVLVNGDCNPNACIPYVCIGADPINATPCISPTPDFPGGDRAKQILYDDITGCPASAEAKACKFYCNDYFHNSGGVCVPNTCNSVPPVYQFTQWCNAIKNTPLHQKSPYIDPQHEAFPCNNTSQPCRWGCQAGYVWDGSNCRSPICHNPQPGRSIACNLNNPAVEDTDWTYEAAPCNGTSAACKYKCEPYYHIPNCTGKTNGTACADDGNFCTQDICDGLGSCTHPNKAIGTVCDDGNPATCGDICTAGICGGGACADCVGRPDNFSCTDDGNQCTDDICKTEVCTHPNKADNTSCNDGNALTCGDKCTAGSCGGGACDCSSKADDTPCTDDGNQCTDDICKTEVCTHPNKTSGTACNDGVACTFSDQCASGSCAGMAYTCGPAGLCQDNPAICDGSGGCTYPNTANGTVCDDLDGDCGDVCNNGSCGGGVSCGGYLCTGAFPANATLIPGDDAGLAADTPRTLVAVDTASKCEYTCNGGYVKSGNSCIASAFNCTGAVPTNATFILGDDTGLAADTPRTVVAADTAAKCEYTCNGGYVKSGNSCIASVFNCTGAVPTNATLCAGDDTGLSADTPNVVSDSCGAAKCEYTCNGGYVKSGNSCIASVFNCTGSVPTNSSICAGDNTGLVADTPLTLVASCGAPKCEYTCNTGYYKSGANCVAYVCTGAVPANATLIAGDDTGLAADTPRTVVVANTAAKCEYTCDGGYYKSGASCVAYVCTGAVPANATLIAGDDTGLIADTPRTVAVGNTAAKCEYTCDSGYYKSGANCVAYVCTGANPTNATLCAGDDTGLSADSPKVVSDSCGVAKCEYTCNGGYVKSGNSCIASTYNCTGVVPTNSSICAGDNTGLVADTPLTLVASCGAPKCEYICNGGYAKSGNSCVSTCVGECCGKADDTPCNNQGCDASCVTGGTCSGNAYHTNLHNRWGGKCYSEACDPGYAFCDNLGATCNTTSSCAGVDGFMCGSQCGWPSGCPADTRCTGPGAGCACVCDPAGTACGFATGAVCCSGLECPQPMAGHCTTCNWDPGPGRTWSGPCGGGCGSTSCSGSELCIHRTCANGEGEDWDCQSGCVDSCSDPTPCGTPGSCYAKSGCDNQCDSTKVDAGCGCGNPGPSGCDNQCGSTKVDAGCGCGNPGPSGCDNQCGSTKVDAGCGCGNPGPSGCDNQCGSTKVDVGCGCDVAKDGDGCCPGSPADACGVCGGDGSSCSPVCPNGTCESPGEDYCSCSDDCTTPPWGGCIGHGQVCQMGACEAEEQWPDDCGNCCCGSYHEGTPFKSCSPGPDAANKLCD